MHFDVLARFQLDAPAVSCERYGCGHINETYLVVTESGRRYILQKISNRAFPDVAGLQENISAVTEFLHTQTDDPYGALTLIPTDEGKVWLHWGENSDWRVYDFIEGSICLQAPETPEDFYQSAIAFGTFQQQLAGFPAHTLTRPLRTSTTPLTASASSRKCWPRTSWAAPRTCSPRSTSSWLMRKWAAVWWVC